MEWVSENLHDGVYWNVKIVIAWVLKCIQGKGGLLDELLGGVDEGPCIWVSKTNILERM